MSPTRRPPHALAASLLVSAFAVAGGCGGGAETPTPAAGGGRGLVVVDASTPERPYFHDFGVVRSDEVVEHVFRLENTDPVPVRVIDVLSSCTCTVPEVRVVHPDGTVTRGDARSREEVAVVPPGGILEVTVRLDAAQVRTKNTDKLSMVRLRTDSPHNTFPRLEVHAFVEQLVQATPPEIDLGDVAVSTGGWGTSDLISGRREVPIEIRGVLRTDAGLSARLEESERFGMRLWVLTAELEPGLPLGPYRGEIVLDVRDSRAPEESRPFTVPVRARVSPDVVLRPPGVTLLPQPGREGLSAEARVVSLVPGARLRVLGVELEGEGAEAVRARAEPVEVDSEGRAQTWRLVLESDPLPPGSLLRGKARVRTDAAGAPPLELAWVARGGRAP